MEDFDIENFSILHENHKILNELDIVFNKEAEFVDEFADEKDPELLALLDEIDTWEIPDESF